VNGIWWNLAVHFPNVDEFSFSNLIHKISFQFCPSLPRNHMNAKSKTPPSLLNFHHSILLVSNSQSISSNPRPHPIRNQIRAMAPQWILRGGRREQCASQRLRGLNTRLLFHGRRGIDVILLWTGTGTDSGGENLLEALGGGDLFDGFEIL